MILTTVALLSEAYYSEIKTGTQICSNQFPKTSAKNDKKTLIPDITASKKGIIHIFDIETKDSIKNSETIQRIKECAEYCNTHKAVYNIVVPMEHEEIVSEALNKSDVSVFIISINT